MVFTWFLKLPPILVVDNVVWLRVSDDAIVADAVGHQQQGQQQQAQQVTDDVVLIRVDTCKRSLSKIDWAFWITMKPIMIQHAPQSSPYVDSGKPSQQHCEYVQRSGDVQLRDLDVSDEVV